MSEGDNACSKLCGEEDDSVRTTVDCLRGRLLAERLASRNAKDDAQQLGNKLMSLEKMVEQEVKSRDRAEKRLKLLFKKLDYMNIAYASSDGFRGKSDISSVSVSVGGDTTDDNNSSENSGSEGQNGNSTEQDSIVENFLFSEGDANSEKSSREGSDHSDICYHRFRFPSEEYGLIKGDVRDGDKCRVDGSMALVVVDNEQQENGSIDPEVLDSAVKEVLDALKLAKERLQSSMEKRRVNMIRVG